MLKNIPSLLSIWFIFLKFLILWFDVCLRTFSSVFHAFCYLSSLSIGSCSIRLLLPIILLLSCSCILAFFTGCVSICLYWSSTWLRWLLAWCMNILNLTWVRLLLLLHFGFVLLIYIWIIEFHRINSFNPEI